MVEFLKKLATIMFYAALPLLIPFFYSLYQEDGGHVSIGAVILILALPAIPELIKHILHTAKNFIDSLFHPEVPWNYAEIIHIKNLGKRVESLTLGEALALTSIAWLVIPFIGSLPYYLYGLSPIDAFFESLSGWTSTGLSVIPSLEGFPPSLLLFRSVTQWIGGLGIVVLMLTVLRGREAAHFFKAEGRTSSEVGIGKTVGMIWKIYLFLTLLGITLLYAFQMDIFNAINLSMSGISSGGFFPFDSYDFINEQKFILTAIMFLGATSFLFYKHLGKGRIKRALFDEEFLLYLSVTLIAFLLVVFIGREDIYNTFLSTVSSITSGGFVIGDITILHDFAKYLLILLMLSGGMMGSTTGGIKLWRILIVLKGIIRHIRSTFLPHGTVQIVKINSRPIDESLVNESSIYIFSYLTIFLFAAGIFIAFNYNLVDALFLVASAMGNVGLSPVALHAIGDTAKLFLMVLMYLGRIEIFPSLALLRFIGGMVNK